MECWQENEWEEECAWDLNGWLLCSVDAVCGSEVSGAEGVGAYVSVCVNVGVGEGVCEGVDVGVDVGVEVEEGVGVGVCACTDVDVYADDAELVAVVGDVGVVVCGCGSDCGYGYGCGCGWGGGGGPEMGDGGTKMPTVVGVVDVCRGLPVGHEHAMFEVLMVWYWDENYSGEGLAVKEKEWEEVEDWKMEQLGQGVVESAVDLKSEMLM